MTLCIVYIVSAVPSGAAPLGSMNIAVEMYSCVEGSNFECDER